MSVGSKTIQKEHPLSGKYTCLKAWIHSEHPHVVVVEMNRARKRNAISAIMWREIGDIFRSLGREYQDRVVVLTGVGTKAFTAGIDITDPAFGFTKPTDDDFDVARRALSFYPQILEMQACFTAIEECPLPVIAAIDGSCIGAGVDLASVCDIRLSSDRARFSVREVRIGLAADVGTLQRFPKITGNDSRVRELCLTGEIFSAKDALEIGFVSRVVPSAGGSHRSEVLEESLRLASKIAENSPVAVLGTKRSLVYSRDHTVADGLVHVATHNGAALMTDDIPEGFLATKQRRKPIFSKMPTYSKL